MMSMVCVGYANESPWQYVETVKNKDIYINPSSIKSYSQMPFDYIKCQLKLNNNNDGAYELSTIIINKDTKDWSLVVLEKYSSGNELTYRYVSPKNVWERYTDGIFQKAIDAILELEQKGSK